MPIEVKGLETIKIVLTELDSKNQKFVSDVLKTASKRVVELVKYLVPVYTGEYKKAWKVLKTNKDSFTIGLPNDPKLQLIFQIKEYTGIKKDFILPKNKKALHWIDFATGEDVFAMYAVVTPEMKNPKPHLRPAIKQLKKEMPSIILALSRKHFKFAKFADMAVPKLPSGNPFGRK
jgi:hypothetical protein